MNHTIQLSERVLESQIRCETNIFESQFGFMHKGSITIKVTYLLKQLLRKYKKKINLYMLFIHL